MSDRSRKTRQLAMGLAFLAPNVLGFLAFTLFPLVVSLMMAFTNWDLRLHNMFKPEARPQFVGLDNFYRLFHEPQLVQFFGNTLFFMAGIPFAIAGSLLLAIMLSTSLGGANRRIWAMLVCGATLVASVVLLAAIGLHATGMTILVASLVVGTLLLGTVGGSTVYRTLFYIPHFTAGVAVFLLWKKLYNPQSGPINTALTPVLQGMGKAISGLPVPLIQGGIWLCLLLCCLVLAWGLRQLRAAWRDGEMGTYSVVLGTSLLFLPAILGGAGHWLPAGRLGLLTVSVGLVAYSLTSLMRHRSLRCRAAEAVGGAMMLGGAAMTLQFVLLGLGTVCYHLPAMAQVGLTSPEWLTDYDWAKPAIMLMGFWSALGSNNMLLYLAGLSNVPGELYEAADIDGASRLQKFWHVTWPQLAPTTFFIVVMSVIGGLQGGFETARTMTQGGPAGSTTTLSYFIYTEGFQTGRLGYSSAVAWTLFLLVLTVTLFNWRFGNRYVAD